MGKLFTAITRIGIKMENYEDFVIVPTDFLRIERDYREFANMEEFEKFTLNLYDFLVKEFPDSYFNKGELYTESIGCDNQYLQGSPEELFEVLKSISTKFRAQKLLVETDLFSTQREEILEAVANQSLEWDYEPSSEFVHVRQIIQHLNYHPAMSLPDFINQTESFGSTIIQSGLESKEDLSLQWVPAYLYSEIRTQNFEE